MANRINANLRWVQRKLDVAGVHDVLVAEILDALNDVEDGICKDYRVKKGTLAVAFNGVLETFAHTGLFSVSYVRIPADWQPIELTTSLQKYELVKEEDAAGTNPRICLVRDGSVSFWPIGASGDTVTLVGDATVSADQVEGTGDPVVSADWDTALRYGALYLITDNEDWNSKCEREIASVGHRMMVASGVIVKDETTQERIRF